MCLRSDDPENGLTVGRPPVRVFLSGIFRSGLAARDVLTGLRRPPVACALRAEAPRQRRRDAAVACHCRTARAPEMAMRRWADDCAVASVVPSMPILARRQARILYFGIVCFRLVIV